MKSGARILLAALLVCLLQACSLTDIARQIVPAGDIAMAQALFQDVRADRMQAAQQRFDKGLSPAPAQLRLLRRLLRHTPPPRMSGVQVEKHNDGPWRTHLTWEAADADHRYAIGLEITGRKGHRHLSRLDVIEVTGMLAVLHTALRIFAAMVVLLALLGGGGVWLWLRHKRRSTNS